MKVALTQCQMLNGLRIVTCESLSFILPDLILIAFNIDNKGELMFSSLFGLREGLLDLSVP